MSEDCSNTTFPKITVLMPVYNSEKYVAEAIESILCQSYTDFEFLIIDDGSTDRSYEVINAFDDPRIRLLDNGKNIGLVASLNNGLECAQGEFIARMDADDISLCTRLEKQLRFLEEHPGTAVAATKVVLIDAAGNEKGFWEADQATTVYDEIRQQLVLSNCIAHPSVMMRKETLDRYRYRKPPLHAEDYDLWLRMSADQIRIEKLDEVLLKYRVHANSVTALNNSVACGAKDVFTKAKFLFYRLCSRKKLNHFDRRVLLYLGWDLCRLAVSKVNKLLRQIVRHALIRTGKIVSGFARHPKSALFFFFPCYHTGGAERVHADIVAAVADQNPWVIFTSSSKGNHFKELFRKNGRLLEPSSLLENSVTRIICLGYFSSLINRTQGPKVLGANTPFFYELLPYLADSVECIDLMHAFGGGLEEVSLPYISRLNRRVVISRKTFDDLQGQYVANGVKKQNLEKILIIENAVAVPAILNQKVRGDRLKVLYVGRGSVEKRVHLVGEIAKLCHEGGFPIDFTLVGDVVGSMPAYCREYCTIVGMIAEPAEMERYYREHELLLVTSSSEGFPMAIMEAMAYGVVPVSTDVGGISAHVVDGVTGFLVPSGEVEGEITGSFVKLLSRLAHNRTPLDEMSEQVYRHALEHFSFERFNRAYRQLLADSKTQEIE